MDSGFAILLVAGGVILLLLIIIISIYNGLIGKKNRVKNAFSTIDVMLKKRHDLIPNLIETVKQYMNHERDTLTEITRLRSQIVDAKDLSNGERINLENQLTSKISGLQLNFENYPDLKANQNFMQLQGSLNEIESQLSASRRAFNASVLEYNNGLEMFPSNIIAGMMNLKQAEFFEIPEIERVAPSVKTLFGDN